jgi:hypothetical protein
MVCQVSSGKPDNTTDSSSAVGAKSGSAAVVAAVGIALGSTVDEATVGVAVGSGATVEAAVSSCLVGVPVGGSVVAVGSGVQTFQ